MRNFARTRWDFCAPIFMFQVGEVFDILVVHIRSFNRPHYRWWTVDIVYTTMKSFVWGRGGDMDRMDDSGQTPAGEIQVFLYINLFICSFVHLRG